MEHFSGGIHRVDFDDVFVRVELKDFLGFVFVNFKAAADHLGLCVVGAVFLHRALAHAVKECFLVFADEVNDFEDVAVAVEFFGLIHAAGQAVEDQEVGVWLEEAKDRVGVHVLVPDAHGDVVWNEIACA